jgi:diguanylate cyclase (GGDEF)-like protein
MIWGILGTTGPLPNDAIYVKSDARGGGNLIQRGRLASVSGSDDGTATDQARLIAAIDTLADSLVMYDADDRLVLANQIWWDERGALSITPELGSTYEEHMREFLEAGRFPEAIGQEETWLAARMERRRNPSSPFEIETGGSSWLLVTDHHLADGGIITIITDITAQKKAEEAAELMRVVGRAANDSIGIEEAARRCLEAVCKYTRWPSGHFHVPAIDQQDGPHTAGVWHHEAREQSPAVSALDAPPASDLVREVLENGTPAWANTIPGRDASQEFLSVIVFPVFVDGDGDGDGDVAATLSFHAAEEIAPDSKLHEIMQDVGFQLGSVIEREQSRKRSLHEASYDRLTGLPSRALGTDHLASALADAMASEGMVALLFIDLDGFKKVNDSLGRETGDRLLQETAQRLQMSIRSDDMVSYWGGDEFVVVLSSPVTPETSELTARRLLKTCSAPYKLDGYELTATVSIGIAMSPYDGTAPMQLVGNAESAMYAAKDAGRDQLRFFTSELNKKAIKHLQMESDLRRAMIEKEFTLHYQPIVRLATNEIVGAEALLRWHTPDGRSIPPDEFIPIAEDTGLIVPIGEWVLRTASGQAKIWQTEASLAEFSIAVNVSPRQVLDGDFTKTVQSTLTDTGLDPTLLELEITERMLIRNDASISTALRDLNQAGIRLAIDDFGTGYSALSYLKEFPFNILKIDRSFVDGVARDQESAGLTRSIIMMAHSLGLEVIAEGIEDDLQLSFLREHKCELGQGYGLGKPMPAQEFTDLIADKKGHQGARQRRSLLEF